MKNAEDLRSIKQKLTQESITMYLSQSRPDSKTIILGVYVMGLKITRLDFPIGSKRQLPDYIKDSKFIDSLENAENNMCFFNCIALATGCRIDRYKKKSKEIFDKFYEKSIKRGKRKYEEYVGFDFVNELDHFEEIYRGLAVNIAGDFQSLIKPHLREEFEKVKNKFFPRQEYKAFDKRTPGLFKVEFEGDGMIALNSKTYFVWNDHENKMSAKGVQKDRNSDILVKEKYLSCLMNNELIIGENKGFRFVDKRMKTYELNKTGLSPVYPKGVVMDDGIHIRPITVF